MCTTVEETAANYLNDNLGFGLTNTTYGPTTSVSGGPSAAAT
jgi:hypothetical protein